jgi:SAM-dependent methyltransferase
MSRNPDPKDTTQPDDGTIPSDAYIRYLAAKKSVDDRALNRYVWQRLKAGLPSSTRRKPLQVMELGAGIGTMFERVLEWRLASHLNYTLVEINPDYIAAFQSRNGQRISGKPPTLAGQTWAEAGPIARMGVYAVETICSDLHDILADRRQHGQWDLIISHAVMDLVDAAEVVAGFARMAKPGGLLYLSLIYDGTTEFVPSADREFERQLLDRYHESMDRRTIGGRPSGSSRTARSMFAHLSALSLPIVAAGASDWIVYPQEGNYAADEAYFLLMIIETIERQLQRDVAIDPHRLAAWAARRRGQVEAGELVFLARNMDFLARRPLL